VGCVKNAFAQRVRHDEWLRQHGELPPLGLPTLWDALGARVKSGRYDRMLATGASPATSWALTLHAYHITTTAERHALARVLRRCIGEATGTAPALMHRIDVDRDNVRAAEASIDHITLWLHSPRTVSPRGMARLRRVITDGTGPLYRFGRGDLDGRLRAVLAAL
jgi:hypothetical protein